MNGVLEGANQVQRVDPVARMAHRRLLKELEEHVAGKHGPDDVTRSSDRRNELLRKADTASAELNEARARLQNILDQIPEELRAVFVLYELERFTMSEIAALMNLPSGTVASRLRKARELFVARAKREQRDGAAR